MNQKESLSFADIFIKPPFYKCPKCNTKNLWILAISSRFCSQKCRNCFYDDWFSLPEIKKEVIYLDQFAVSNFMKCLNKRHPSYWNKWLNIWREIYEKIDTLLHYQLIICPYSSIHEEESVLTNKTYTQAYWVLRSMYNHLGYWNKFPHQESIKRDQFYSAFQDYITGNKSKINEYIYVSQFHDWSDTIYISIQTWLMESMLDDIELDKKRIHSHINKVYQNVWTKEDRDFDYWFRLEMKVYWQNIFDRYRVAIENLAKVHSWNANIQEVYWSIACTERLLVDSYMQLLERHGVSSQLEQFIKIQEYLVNTDLSSIPIVLISSALWAWIAKLSYWWNISGKQINAWMFNDVSAIAHYLPYSDAMLVDWVLERIINYKLVKEKISNYTAKVFSWKDSGLKEFIAYLDSIYSNMTPEHKNLVEKIYGKNFKPYTSIYKN